MTDRLTDQNDIYFMLIGKEILHQNFSPSVSNSSREIHVFFISFFTHRLIDGQSDGNFKL